ncbi:NAD-dependent epimerase/dehydratase family protein [Rathayibacter tanaceti]|uniref:NAD-dependent epimerase/dehydratase family protein n=1 Tax=Rathayibacter tanaceti TaxID=1671680 RepID=A0AAE6RN01_9MICO|nr:NAD-dependent epimerase/dehydratase family protein [Rathayibacter tanaceti]QHC56715.1 NAD-dependent epimerase/dehydratase family protein [Rathayibacter tanaceti]
MRFLLLGGTAWLGGHLASEALRRGHEVTCVARGSAVPAGARFVRADRDRDEALAPVAGTRWDAVIDVARRPDHVRRAVRDLTAGRYLFVSTTSVYASHADPGADEDAELLPPLEDPDEYGSAKAACEQAVLAGSAPALIARAGLLGGPGDPTGRSSYWPWRFAVGGAVLVPDAPELPTAVLDVRDLAAWLVHCAEEGAGGVMNVAGRSMPLVEHLALARGDSPAEPVAVAEEWLLARGVQQWAGPDSLPLWIADPAWRGMNARSTARAEAAGLVRREPAETLREAAAARGAGGAGLGEDRERERTR